MSPIAKPSQYYLRWPILLSIITLIVLSLPSVVFAAQAHGGYARTTDVCTQCHDLHEAASDYALLYRNTVTATCNTCHSLYSEPPTGAISNPYPGSQAPVLDDDPGTTSPSTAYEVSTADKDTHQGHRLGLGLGPILFADGNIGDGDYIPGGSDTLTRILQWDTTRESALTGAATNGLYCDSCHSSHAGTSLPDFVFNNWGDSRNKLLSSRPNHAEFATPTKGLTSSGLVEDQNLEDPDPEDVSDWGEEGGIWCGVCHDRRIKDVSSADDNHRCHSFRTCVVCHGNSSNEGDFPHTTDSTDSGLLSLEPPDLCLQCHPGQPDGPPLTNCPS